MSSTIRFSFIGIAISLPLVLSGIVAVGQNPAPKLSVQQVTFFESKIRPLLLTSCVNCHSKDNAQGALRLDAPITSEKAAEVIRRVKGEGGKPKMPQGGQLAPDKIAAIEEWVKTGAGWPATTTVSGPSLMERGKTHWAFQPIRRPSVPKVKNTAWPRNPIDNFVLARLERQGMKPNPAATRRELIRRVAYDLTGLPPTPEEVTAFENDKSSNAYEKLVDRLLASPHYGEKWGRHWLDLVRYAETNSYERDNPKPYVFKYRDYVVRALNNDKPYDQFVKEQLAGDEMPSATGDAVVATGYYRLGIWDDEPADRLQASMDDLDDLIATTGQAFLGLTMDCARCHDHKLDPIPQKDYYKLQAIFHNINRFKNGGPTDEARYYPSEEAKIEHEKRMKELLDKRQAFKPVFDEFESALKAKGSQFYNLNDVSDVSYSYYERDWKRIPDFENEPVIASGKLEPGLISLKPRMRNEEFSLSYNGQINVPKEGDYEFFFKAEGGYRFNVDGLQLENYASDGKATEHSGKKHLTAGKKGFSLIFNQRQKQHGFAIAWSGPDFKRRPLSALDSCGEDSLEYLIGPEGKSALGTAAFDRYAKAINELSSLEKQAPLTDKVLCVTEEGPKPKETFVLLRGVPTAKGEKVEPGFPVCVSSGEPIKAIPVSSGKSAGLRTQLANWIASPDNPLAPRVIVNRIWQHHFGKGIVRTPSDFGLTGAAPTHPELLDWLCKEFIAQGWSFKKLHKLILTSNTYKQSSKGNAVGLARDPQNDNLWRFEMRRLTAEEIRDSMLGVCGNINLAMFGPSVYPDIPKDILAAQSRPGKDWFMERMTAEDVCRRSIYINVKRSLVYPILASFDLPETDRPSAMRFASTQPTQALALMNGPLFTKQADILKARVIKEAGSDPRNFSKRLFHLVMQRPPTEKEILEGIALYNRLLSRGASQDIALRYLSLMALNLDEFVYLD